MDHSCQRPAREGLEEVSAEQLQSDQSVGQSVGAVSAQSSARAELLLQLLQAQLPRTAAHCRRVGLLSAQIGARLGLSEEALGWLKLAGELHDIGKLLVPRRALSKPSGLASTEYEEVQRHPTLGAQLLSLFPELAETRAGILSHHERFDGSGYPQALSGEEIPLQARIISIADCYDAMTNDRAYRSAMSPEEARDELAASAGSQLDPTLVALALPIFAEQTQQPEQTYEQWARRRA